MSSEINYYEVDAMSNSRIGWVKTYPENCKRLEGTDSDAFKFGRMLHCRLLEPEKYDERYAVEADHNMTPDQKRVIDDIILCKIEKIPCDTLSIFYRYYKGKNVKDPDKKIIADTETTKNIINSNQGYIQESIDSWGKEIIKIEDLNLSMKMEQGVRNNEYSRPLVFPEPGDTIVSENQKIILSKNFKHFRELDIYFDLTIFGDKLVEGLKSRGINPAMKLKSKIDSLIVDVDNNVAIFSDPKSTRMPLTKFGKSYIEYDYRRPMGFYSLAVQAWLIQNDFKNCVNNVLPFLLPIEKKEPNRSFPAPISEKELKEGRNEVIQLLADYSWHEKEGLWEFPRSFYEQKGIILKSEPNERESNFSLI